MRDSLPVTTQPMRRRAEAGQSLLAVASGDRQANECRIGDCLRRFLRHSTFDIRHSRHILLIPGTSSVDHLRENVAGCRLESSEWDQRDRR